MSGPNPRSLEMEVLDQMEVGYPPIDSGLAPRQLEVWSDRTQNLALRLSQMLFVGRPRLPHLMGDCVCCDLLWHPVIAVVEGGHKRIALLPRQLAEELVCGDDKGFTQRIVGAGCP